MLTESLPIKPAVPIEKMMRVRDEALKFWSGAIGSGRIKKERLDTFGIPAHEKFTISKDLNNNNNKNSNTNLYLHNSEINFKNNVMIIEGREKLSTSQHQ